jgi:glycosyltransferase involved in cell wall biosynthesis
MELSVIIPCLNAEATIATQLEALASQHWSKTWEVIVADNGSTDKSMEIVKSYKGLLPNLRIVDASSKKGKSYYARNVGAWASAGKALVFCDADDWVAPGWVSAMGEALAHHDIVYGQMCFDKFNEAKEAEYHARRWVNGLYRGRFLPGGGGANTGAKRSVHEAIGGFDECLPRFADGDYYWRLQLKGFKLHYEPKAVYQYRIGRVNPSLPYLYRRGMTAAASSYWLYKKYRSLGVTKDMIVPPYRSFERSVKSWLQLLKNMPSACLRSTETRARWLQHFAEKTGEVVGHFQGRLMTPCQPYSPDGKHARLDFGEGAENHKFGVGAIERFNRNVNVIPKSFLSRLKARAPSNLMNHLTPAAISISLVLSLLLMFSDRCKVFRTEDQIEDLRFRIETYRLEHWAYPETLNVISRAKDPWGRQYIYRPSGNSFILISSGPDGREGTPDDIS